jgi:hypothetical protein
MAASLTLQLLANAAGFCHEDNVVRHRDHNFAAGYVRNCHNATPSAWQHVDAAFGVQQLDLLAPYQKSCCGGGGCAFGCVLGGSLVATSTRLAHDERLLTRGAAGTDERSWEQEAGFEGFVLHVLTFFAERSIAAGRVALH